MAKYIRDFKNLNDAKQATLFSPMLVNVSDNGNSRLLIAKVDNAEMVKIDSAVSSLDDLKASNIKPAYRINYVSTHGNCPNSKVVQQGYVLQSSDLPTLSEEGWTFGGWDKSVGYIINENTIITANWVITPVASLVLHSAVPSSSDCKTTITYTLTGASYMSSCYISFNHDEKEWTTSVDLVDGTFTIDRVFYSGTNGFIPGYSETQQTFYPKWIINGVTYTGTHIEGAFRPCVFPQAQNYIHH